MNVLNPPHSSTLFEIFVIPLFVLLSWSIGWGSTQSSPIHITMEYWAPYYSPALAMVPEGESVRIRNPTSSPHTITHEGCRKSGPCAFDTGAVQPGEDFLISSLPPGRYPYYCELHPIMRGEIVVIPRTPLLNQAAAHDRSMHTPSTKEQ
jgi:plastocyanin